MLKVLFYFLLTIVLLAALVLELTRPKRTRFLLQQFCIQCLSASDKQAEKERIYDFLKNMSPPPKEPIKEEFDEQENSDEEQEGEESEEDS
ncbi:MAG: hypothetical protein N3A69_08895 [Leptospiraceae bacterium]|nr:hypothetical protein [Leptospiraceae bacterium]